MVPLEIVQRTALPSNSAVASRLFPLKLSWNHDAQIGSMVRYYHDVGQRKCEGKYSILLALLGIFACLISTYRIRLLVSKSFKIIVVVLHIRDSRSHGPQDIPSVDFVGRHYDRSLEGYS